MGRVTRNTPTLRLTTRYRYLGVVHYGRLFGGTWCDVDADTNPLRRGFVYTTACVTCLWCITGLRS